MPHPLILWRLTSCRRQRNPVETFALKIGIEQLHHSFEESGIPAGSTWSIDAVVANVDRTTCRKAICGAVTAPPFIERVVGQSAAVISKPQPRLLLNSAPYQ